MWKNLKLLLLFLLLPLLWTGGTKATDDIITTHPAGFYTLTDLYRMALKNAEAIQITEEDVNLAHRNREKALSALLPNIKAFGSYTRYTEDHYAGDALIQPEWSSGWGARLDQSVTLNGKEFTALKQSGDNIKKSEYDLHAFTESYLFSVASAYYDVIKAVKGMEIAQANVKRLKAHRESVAIRLSLEEVAKTDMYRAEAELSQSSADLIGAENNLKLAKRVLGRMTGISKTFNVRVPAPVNSPYFKARPAELIKTGLKNRAELRALDMQKQIARDQLRIVKSAYWPSLRVEGVWMNPDQDPGSDFLMDDSISIGLNLDFTLFDGGFRRAGVREALSAMQRTKLAFDDLSKEISLEIEQVYLEIMTHIGELNSLRDQFSYSRENYNAVSKQFQYGLATSVDVMDANTLLLTSEKRLTESRYSFQLAELKLKRMTGTFLNDILKTVSIY